MRRLKALRRLPVRTRNRYVKAYTQKTYVATLVSHNCTVNMIEWIRTLNRMNATKIPKSRQWLS